MPNLPRDAAGKISDARNFVRELSTDPTAVGLTAAQITLLTAKTDDFEDSVNAQDAAETAKREATADKRAKETDFEAFFRELRQIAQKHPGTTDVDRARLKLATGEGKDEGGDPLESAPLVEGEQGGIHDHIIYFFMAGEKSSSTKKPRGVFGAPIYVKIGGEATTNLKEYEMATLDRKAPYLMRHDAADAGKVAHYICLWEDADGNRSPQSAVFSMTIT